MPVSCPNNVVDSRILVYTVEFVPEAAGVSAAFLISKAGHEEKVRIILQRNSFADDSELIFIQHSPTILI